VAGGYLLGFFTMLLNTYLPLEILKFRNVFVFGFIILVLVLRPQGLVGRKVEEKI
jgi:branched-chain amino acid transport system permease protein